MTKKILILCTGNSCRSQMAEGFLKSFDSQLEVYSAGTNPSEKVDPHAIKVMKEAGIDLSNNYPKSADQFINNSFDFVITVCDNAKETCPVFSGKVGSRRHIGFEDPAGAIGTEEEILSVFRRIRNEIKKDFYEFYKKISGEYMEKYKVLFVCVHNSARSQMAEAYLNKFGGERFSAESAGLEAGRLNPIVVEVMKEDGIDISGNKTTEVFDLFKQGKFYSYVVPVCDKEAAEKCPIFPGARHDIQWSFKDPSKFEGSYEEKLSATRVIRDQIKNQILVWLKEFNSCEENEK